MTYSNATLVGHRQVTIDHRGRKMIYGHIRKHFLFPFSFISLFLFSFTHLFIGVVNAQNAISVDTTLHLAPLTITQTRLQQFAMGNLVETIDSSVQVRYQIQNLASVLSAETPIFIKSYGLGSLATPSFRGTNANHTAVLWNGFNLQSTMNGTTDFALLPVNSANDIKVQYGGSSALFGNGAIGGTIHLNHRPQFQEKKQLRLATVQEMGSFGQYRQEYTLQWSEKKNSSQTTVWQHQGKHDFPFKNTTLPTQPIQYQQNAALKQWGIIQNNAFRLGKRQNQILNVAAWYQNTNRQIPPTLTTAQSEAYQQDEHLRLTTQWQTTQSRQSYTIRAAFFHEDLCYADPAIDLNADNLAQSLMLETEAKWQIEQRLLGHLGTHTAYHQAETDGYGTQVNQNRMAVFGSLKYRSSKETLQATASLRQEWVDGQDNPLMPSLGFHWQMHSQWTIKTNASRNYRLPTFNDLYWMPGGNPDLQAEIGWSENVSLIYQIPQSSPKKLDWKLSISAYAKQIQNWIAWTPNANTGIWQPENLNQVDVKGIESKINLNWKVNKNWKTAIKFAYNHTLSVNRKGAEASLGKQLIYVPKHSVQSQLQVAHKHWQLNYGHQLVGKRYTTTDNSQYLPAYQLAGVWINRQLNWQSKAKQEGKRHYLNTNISLKINNLWNTDYQTIAFRPMPKRYFSFTLGANFE